MIKIGTRLQVSLEGRDRKMESELVGLKKYHYFIVKLPENILYVGNKVVVRYMQGSKIYAFRSKVLANIFDPDILVFLHYPSTIEQQELRRSPRYPCSLPATAEIGYHVVQAVISDLSTLGAMLIVDKETSGLHESRLKTNTKITCSFYFPGSEQQYTFTGLLKNVMSRKHCLRVGLEFNEIGPEPRLLLTDYLDSISFSLISDD